jgi:rare lipoprotein A
MDVVFPSHIMRLFRSAALVTLSLLSAACAGRETPADRWDVLAPTQTAAPTLVPGRIYRETGVAAWHGEESNGKKKARNEVFDREMIAAAHRTLPLGTLVRVTNLKNSKSINVTITERGPFIKSRILDLSYGVAKELDFIAHGIARVKIETVDEVRDPGPYTVQAAVYTEEENAKLLKYRLSKRFELVFIVPLETNITRLYCVRVGSYASEERAEQIADKLKVEGLEPVVLRKD